MADLQKQEFRSEQRFGQDIQQEQQQHRAPIEQRKLSKRNFEEVPIPQTFNMSPTSQKLKGQKQEGNLFQRMGDKIAGAFGYGEKKDEEKKPK